MERGGRRIGRSDRFVLQILKHALVMWSAIKNFFVDCHMCLFAVYIKNHVFSRKYLTHIGLYDVYC